MNINATLLAQMIVFFILALFTMKFVWPPIMKALDERREKIKQGLEAAEKNQDLLKDAEQQVKQEINQARQEGLSRVQDAEKQAKKVAEEIKQAAQLEAEKIIRDAQSQIDQGVAKAKQALKQEIASLVIKGAEQILKREVNAQSHGDVIRQLETEFSR